MKLSQLRNFIAVVEAGTVRQAARNLNLSQSSVSKSIQQLEDELGAEMLHRGAHGVTPTAAGKALLAHAKVIEAELRHARNDVQTVQGAQVGEIRVSASPTVAMGLLPRAVVAFQRARPRVSFRIWEGVYPDILPAIRTGDLDFAICLVPTRPRDESLSFMNLVKDHLVPAVRAEPSHGWRAQASARGLARPRLDHLPPQPYWPRRFRADLRLQPPRSAEEHNRMHLLRLRARSRGEWRLRHARALSDLFRRSHVALDCALAARTRRCSLGRSQSSRARSTNCPRSASPFSPKSSA